MSHPVSSIEAYVDFTVGSNTYKTYYKLFGKITSTSPRPLVVLHGGPGIPSPYLEPFSDITAAHGIPVVIYDQIGCGKSTHLKDKGADFFTMDLFMDELDNLLEHLDIAGNFDLAGHSWGSMLGSWYAAVRQPPGLKHLVLGSPLARMRDWVESNEQLAKTLPQDVQDIISKSEATGSYDTPEYQAASGQFMATFICRMNPFPDGVMASLQGFIQDPHVSHLMSGPAMLHCYGTLKDWSVVDLLHNIKVPTLLYNGEFDQAQEFVIEPFLRLVPNIKWVHFKGYAHMLHYENRDECMKTVGDFLTSA